MFRVCQKRTNLVLGKLRQNALFKYENYFVTNLTLIPSIRVKSKKGGRTNG